MAVRRLPGDAPEEQEAPVGVWQALLRLLTHLVLAPGAPAVALAVGPGARAEVAPEQRATEEVGARAAAPAVAVAEEVAPAPAAAPPVHEAPAAAPPVPTFFYTEWGKRYHGSRTCRGLRNAVTVLGPVNYAAVPGHSRQPCRVCRP